MYLDVDYAFYCPFLSM